MRFSLLASSAILLSACAATTPAPKLVVLGIAQDAGVPQAACTSDNCEAARRDPTKVRRAASLLLAGRDGSLHLFDASPDLPAQLDDAIEVGVELGREAPPRRPLDGVFLTHAHMGHYLGLAHLGFEAAHTQGVDAYGTEKMITFLRGNAPWDQLVELGNIEPSVVTAGAAVEVGGVRVIPVPVPHRAEYTDTVGYRIEGPHRTAIYIPDADPWTRWGNDPMPLFEGVDVALLDATFHSADELPGRDLSAIGHPLVVDTMDRFQSRVDEGTLDVRFIHLNHSNPALDPRSSQAREIESRGFTVAQRGDELPL